MLSWLKRIALVVVLVGVAAGIAAHYAPDTVKALIAGEGLASASPVTSDSSKSSAPEAGKDKPRLAPPPTVSVVTAAPRALVAEALLTGTLVARDEVLVAPQVEGQRIVDLMAEEGQRVAKGDLLARLVSDNLEAQLAQSDAAIARSEAAIAQAESAILQAEARLKEAQNAYARAVPLSRDGYMPTSTLETREASASTARAALTTARDGLMVARADKAQAVAQRREVEWRRDNTEIRAPAAGIVSRRTAKVGAMASGQGDALFRIVADGVIELDAEVPESDLARISVGQQALVSAAGGITREARVRLISPEVDRTTRLGRVRLTVGEMGTLKVGGFAKAVLTLVERRALAVVASAIMYDAEGAYVLAVEDGRARLKRIRIGITANGYVEVQSGLVDGDSIVARAGTFLRDGDAVRPVTVGGAATVTTGAIGSGSTGAAEAGSTTASGDKGAVR